MSNYLLVVSNEETSRKVSAWLKKYSVANLTEIVQSRIGHDRWLTYVSREPDREFRPAERVIFKGFAIDYARESIALGVDGFAQYLAAHGLLSPRKESLEGCYFSARWDDGVLRVTSDLFSLCPVLYTAGKSVVAVSDSTYVLAELRRALGLKCSLNEQSVLARSWGNAMAGQMLSEDTLVDEIKYAHVGTVLDVSIGEEIGVRVEHRSVREDFALEETNYRDAIRQAAQRIASSLNSLAQISQNFVRMAVSGGVDSRVCLAAALATEAGRQQAAFNCINTNASHAKDYLIVESLSEKFGFPLGLRASAVNERKFLQKIPSKLGLWFLANAGIYDFLYLPPAINNNRAAASISGHGAELLKGNYGWKPISRIATVIADKSASSAFLSQSEGAIAAIGVAPNDPYGSEWHYLGFRNALHSGRFVIGSMAGFRPLMQRSLVALSRSSLNEWPAPKKGEQSVISDLLICMSPAMAAHPFDDDKKNMSETDVEARSRYLGGGISESEVVSYRVFGSFTDIVSGFPTTFSALAAERHGAQAWERDSLRLLVEKNYERLDGRVREVYGPVRDEAITRLADENQALSQMRGSIGKLLSFDLLQ